MKRTIVLLLAALMILALVACGGTVKESDDTAAPASEKPVEPAPPAPAKIADDSSVIGMSYIAPTGYETVDRFYEYLADGTMTQKSMTYNFENDDSLMFGYTLGENLTDAVPQSALDGAEKKDIGGKSFYVISQGKSIIAAEQEGDVVYGIGYDFAESADRAKFDEIAAGVNFADTGAPVENSDDLYNIRFKTESAGHVCKMSNTLTEKPDGTTVKKSIMWYFGADKDNVDYRFVIRVFKNSTVEEQLDPENTYDDVEINGVSYKGYKSSYDDHYIEYFTRYGDDVYQIRNNGVSSGWFVDRSEESHTAFDAFINSVSFE